MAISVNLFVYHQPGDHGKCKYKSAEMENIDTEREKAILMQIRKISLPIYGICVTNKK